MMTEQEFSRISTYLKNKYGIDMSKKKVIMNGRLENYVKTNGFKSYSEFINSIEKDKNGELEKVLVNLLTTNHTYFMRESEHFNFLKEEVMPWLKEKEKINRDLAIWCGASSTGEEPYTLAMLFTDFFGLEAAKWDTKILATDISTAVLKHAMAGIYTSEQIAPLPDAWKRRYFKYLSESDCYQANKLLKDQLIFRKFNLMEPFPFRRKMHVVFMRNVMIYFDDKTKNELCMKIYNQMESGGYLFVGRTETLDRSKVPFELVQPSIFRKI